MQSRGTVRIFIIRLFMLVFARCSKCDEKPLVIKFLVTPVREVLLPVVNQERREKFRAHNAKHANDQSER